MRAHPMNRHVEYLIVGAGAAGCALAWALSQAGRETLVLELRDLREKDKLCGGVLGADALREIELIFGPGSLAQLAPLRPKLLRERCLDRELANPTSFASLPRKRLDDWLCARCLEAGAEVQDRTSLVALDADARTALCENLRSGETARISYGQIIGADGAASAVRRLLTGRKQRVALSFEGSAPPTATDFVFAYHPMRLGYCWHIPTGEAANVGCMLHEATPAACRAWLEEFCGQLGLGVFGLRGAPIPTGDDTLLRAGEHAWLIGDAAGLARPTDGGGIHFALASARLLAEAFLGGAPYEKAMQPILEGIARATGDLQSYYFFNALRIARKGRLWEEGPAHE